MALQKNSFLLKGGLKITNSEPVDERILFPGGITDVTAITSAVTDTYYKGLVASTPEGKLYVLTGNTPSAVTSWADVTGESVPPLATEISLGKNLVYSGQTLAPAESAVTDAFDAVVEQMINNEQVVSAALNDLNDKTNELSATTSDLSASIVNLIQEDNNLKTRVNNLTQSAETLNTNVSALTANVNNLSQSAATLNSNLTTLSGATVYIEGNYAKKSDISSVYKIVAANVINISNSGYTTETGTVTGVDIGNVVNTVSSVTYDGKTYPVGTNFVCLHSGETAGKWDALAGIEDLSGYAKTSQLLTGITINGSGYVTGITFGGDNHDNTTELIVNLNNSIKVTEAAHADEADSATMAATLTGFTVVSATTLSTVSGSVVGMVAKDDSSNKVLYKLVDFINSAKTAESASSAETANALKDFAVSVTGTTSTVPKAAIWTIEKESSSNKVVFQQTNKIYSAATSDALDGFDVQKVETITTSAPGYVVVGMGLSGSTNKIVYAYTDLIHSATTASQDSEGRNIADTFALLDQYPAKATKPSVTLDIAASEAFPLVGEVGVSLTATSINYTATTIAGHFNEAEALSPKTSPAYTVNNLTVGITGGTDTGETIYVSPELVTAGTINGQFTSFPIAGSNLVEINNLSYGANTLQLDTLYNYGGVDNSPKTLFGVQTTKTGKTAAEGTAIWNTGSVRSSIKTITVYGAYPIQTNMTSASTNATGAGHTTTSGSGDTIIFNTIALDADITNTKYVLYNPNKTYYFTFPPTTTLSNKFYKIMFPSALTISSIKKYNDLAHVYDGDVTYDENTITGLRMITIQAPAESQAPQYRLILT